MNPFEYGLPESVFCWIFRAETPSGVSEGLEENPPKENPGLFYCPGESGRKLQMHKYYPQTVIYAEWAAHYMER